MARLVALPGHVFWQDEISLLNTKFVDQTRFLNASQVTDTYLLALACAKDGMLATFDHHLVASTVIGGSRALHLIA